MIRLTHQFDPAYVRASAASPKSSGCCSCCSCCCCVVTALGASVITARAIRSPPPPVVLAQVESRELSPTTGSPELPAPPAKLWRWRLFGFLLFPLPFIVGIIIDSAIDAPVFSILGLLFWPAGLTFLAITKRIKWPMALAILVLTVGLSILEGFLWIQLVFK